MEIAPGNNGLTRERGRKLLGVKPEEFLLLYFGYIYQGKGIETLLQAFQTVTHLGRPVRLGLVGGEVALPARPHYGQEMRALSKHLGIDDKVIWTGGYAWDSDEASVYLRAADACILPFDKGIQLNNSSFAAAAAHGLPIITTQGATIESPFIPAKNVLLLPPQTPEALATAITTLLDSPALRQRLGQGALQLSQEWFSWKKTVERTITTLSVQE
jgi:glycosyltransferase involved in cell wall biosynthesis